MPIRLEDHLEYTHNLLGSVAKQFILKSKANMRNIFIGLFAIIILMIDYLNGNETNF